MGRAKEVAMDENPDRGEGRCQVIESLIQPAGHGHGA